MKSVAIVHDLSSPVVCCYNVSGAEMAKLSAVHNSAGLIDLT